MYFCSDHVPFSLLLKICSLQHQGGFYIAILSGGFRVNRYFEFFQTMVSNGLSYFALLKSDFEARRCFLNYTGVLLLKDKLEVGWHSHIYDLSKFLFYVTGNACSRRDKGEGDATNSRYIEK
jgi:hypothetical protein